MDAMPAGPISGIAVVPAGQVEWPRVPIGPVAHERLTTFRATTAC
jgi:hypothetical protein